MYKIVYFSPKRDISITTRVENNDVVDCLTDIFESGLDLVSVQYFTEVYYEG